MTSKEKKEKTCNISSPCRYMDVSKNSGTPKSSILIGFSIINHPFWGTPYFWKHPHVPNKNPYKIHNSTLQTPLFFCPRYYPPAAPPREAVVAVVRCPFASSCSDTKPNSAGNGNKGFTIIWLVVEPPI